MMMAKDDEGSSGFMDGLFRDDDRFDGLLGDASLKLMDELFSGNEESEDVSIDLDSFWRVMEEPTEPSQDNMLEDLPFINYLKGLQNSKEVPSPIADLPGVDMLSPSHNSEASDCRTGCSDGLSESAGTPVVEDSKRIEPSSRPSLPEHCCSRSDTDCIPVQGSGYSFTHTVAGSQIPTSYCQNDSEKAPLENTNHCGTLSSYSADHVIYDGESAENYHLSHEEDMSGCSEVDAHTENLYRQKFMENANLGTYVAHVGGASTVDGERTSQDAFHTDAGLHLFSSDDPSYFTYGLESLACNGDKMVNIMDEGKNPSVDFSSLITYEDLFANEFEQHVAKCGSGSSISLNDQVGVSKCNDMHATGYELKKLFPNTLSNVFSKVQDDVKVKKTMESITSNEIVSRASEVIDDIISRKYYGDPGTAGETPIKRSAMGAHDWHPVLQVSGQPGMLPLSSIKKMEDEMPKLNGYQLPNITYQGARNNMSEQRNLENDSDVCILEELSAPARPMALNSKLVADSQFLRSRDPIGHAVIGHSRFKSNERVIFRVAVQDLSQPKSEATPPDGLLAVPLLKHQRIALSWMINKETKSICCSGGILADDQGLGKTVSTIALILKERSPSSKAPKANNEQNEAEMLNLDEDDGTSETYHVKEPCEDNGGNAFLQTKGRPAAGTLIVCPTSVLRQWSEELTNKVTKEADLSVLVYHGSNRTKDPLELAKYDVVVTTYAIVSMEVPKQPVVDENDDQIGTPFKGYSSSKKRKLLENTPGKKPSTSKKSKKGIDNELLESISGPLAKVGWFRVVLDEAQSIKNHRTQVARACWGLRAKRRWCLSGTPIQNTIDDLYSYFRFLRHEPYAIFKTFCEQIKAPIHKNPKDGYKKLQAVLKTIMLRRTKGTFLDGEPIISLPPKTIELKKVDFSKEERDFYCRLEADSRAQFAEYAAAGTVKQNYVNILLMLLRLRQACDHPLLVKGFNSNAQITSSIEMAKKLPREKHIFLLNCLEASLAICGICSDPPEDAVVTICGHVFCNQCICEHMIADDIQCPTKNCRTHLTTSHVFSISTLRGAMSDQQSVENTSNFSHSELAKVSESRSLSCPNGSSKIKAALELLLSLAKPQDPASRTRSTESVEGYHGREMLLSCDSGIENGTSFVKTENDSVKVVGEKAIVFSQWTRMLDLLEGFLKNSSIQYRRLDGTMPVVARDRAVKDFNSLPQVSVMIMSLKAASLGLNMVAACNVILLDLWWNPTTEDQAIDRAHRIGQTRPVSVFRLTVKDTVEDRILALQQRKREMVAAAFGEDGTGSRQSRLTVEDLKYLFRAD